MSRCDTARKSYWKKKQKRDEEARATPATATVPDIHNDLNPFLPLPCFLSLYCTHPALPLLSTAPLRIALLSHPQPFPMRSFVPGSAPNAWGAG